MSSDPEVFGKYILLEKLAAGGMAEIYLAKSPGAENVSKFVGIKRILPQYSQNEDFISMFKEEAKIAINLSHSNIVSIFEFGEVQKQFYLAMEYVQGRNLRQVLNRMRKEKQYFSLEHILYIVNEAARGLDHAHRCVDGTTGRPLNITHRDMSPQNIMIGFDGEVKIIDFGIAKAESKVETTKAGTLKGKFGYMSPEQADGLEVDFRTDLFSLGIVLWELLARERLFIANNEMNTLRKIRECHVPSLQKIDPNIPSELEEITNKALVRDRSLRYPSCIELHRDLNRFLNRHYPDFSSQDFSDFMKKLYAKERAELREKMIEYARIVIQTNDDKTEVLGTTQTITQTNPTSAEDRERLQNLVPRDKEKMAADVQLDDLAVDRKEVIRQVYSKNKKQPGKNIAIPIKMNTNSNIKYPRSGVPINTGINTGVTSVAHSNSSGWSFKPAVLAVLGIAVVAIFLLFKPQIGKQLSNAFGLSGKITKESGTENTASTQQPLVAQYQMLFTSSPPFAEIYINGKNTKQMTPYEVSMPAGKTFKLTLKRQGYVSHTEMVNASQSGEVRRKLKKATLGYLNLSIRPGNAKVYINGKKIKSRPPLKRFPVNAGIPLKIQAYGTIGKTYGEATVTVQPNKIRSVEIFIRAKKTKVSKKKYSKKRKPSSKKRRTRKSKKKK